MVLLKHKTNKFNKIFKFKKIFKLSLQMIKIKAKKLIINLNKIWVMNYKFRKIKKYINFTNKMMN